MPERSNCAAEFCTHGALKHAQPIEQRNRFSEPPIELHNKLLVALPCESNSCQVQRANVSAGNQCVTHRLLECSFYRTLDRYTRPGT
jgi:hypothetical protein